MRDNNSCQYCNYRGSDLSIDHVLPRSRGGTDNWENVTTACLRCNVQKGNALRRSKYAFKRKPYRPLSNLNFEATRQIDSGRHKEWSKYVMNCNLIKLKVNYASLLKSSIILFCSCAMHASITSSN